MTVVITTPTDRPAAVWRDRSTHWSIALGPLKVARTTTRLRYVGSVGPAERSQPMARGVLMWVLALLVLGGCLTLGVAAQASAQRARFTTPIIDIVMLAQPAPKPVEPEHPAHRALPPKEAALGEPSDNAGNNPSNFDRFPAVRRAIEAAFQTGDAQDWTEGAYQGLVVAGAPYEEGRKTCRETAILLRDGGFEGTTKSTITCRASITGGEG